MSIIGFIKGLFKKKIARTHEEIDLEIGLEKWKGMKNVSPTFVYMLLDNNNLNDIAPALVHADRITINHILNCAETLGKKGELISLVNKFQNISIHKSNKMKVHIMNNLIDKRYVDFMRGKKGIGGAYFG
jgi:hypothetical protein